MPRVSLVQVCAGVCAAAMLAQNAIAGPAEMWIQWVNTFDPLAVCNDGSPAGYYWQAATTQPSVWLVYLEGGMW